MELWTAIGTVLGIAVLQIYRDWRDGKNLFKRNGSYEAQQTLKQIRDSQFQLQQHFNDETTAILTDMRDTLQKMERNIDKHTFAEENFQQNMRDFMREMREKK